MTTVAPKLGGPRRVDIGRLPLVWMPRSRRLVQTRTDPLEARIPWPSRAGAAAIDRLRPPRAGAKE